MHLRLEEIEKSYRGQAVLRGISATFPPGRIGALIGPNGAGKTTLLRIAAGLQRADRGAVHATDVVYFGGFDTLPVGGSANGLRRALGLPPSFGGRCGLARLSRGQQQSAGVYLALDSTASTVLLDEPWTALEPDARDALNVRLRFEAAAGRIVLCSSHDLDEVCRVADDVVFLREGRLTSASRDETAPDRPFDRQALLRGYREGLLP
jgi:ABC-type multidrug transport system ATPase subunit